MLSAADAELYRRIFALQADARFKDADQLIARLSDDLLMGHVLAQRLTNERTRPKAEQISTWLSRYADHPDAGDIQALAHKFGLDAGRVKKTRSILVSGEDEGAPDDEPYVSPKKRNAAEARKAEQIVERMRTALRKGDLKTCAKLLQSPETKTLLDPVELALLKARQAQGEYFMGDLKVALSLALEAAPTARAESTTADWIAGLTLWRLDRPEEAAPHFEAVAASHKADSWTASAGAFWAARAELLARHPEKVTALLGRAAEEGRTFYGLLAARQLGIEDKFNWGLPVLTDEHFNRLLNYGGVKRAVALVEAQQHGRAEAELALIQSKAEPAMRKPLLALARRLDLAAAQLRIAGHVMSDGQVFDAALYPIPAFRPSGGFTIDRAFLYALMRQESRFDPGAQNKHTGATGLMQIMPDTARHVVKTHDVEAGRLSDPTYNLSLGQRYVETLCDAVQGARSLFLVAAAYNAGPSSLARWRDRLRDIDDPLLFVESMPSGQTRSFVMHVAASYWIYRMRLGLDSPSLDAAASGTWPLFANAAEVVKVRMVRN